MERAGRVLRFTTGGPRGRVGGMGVGLIGGDGSTLRGEGIGGYESNMVNQNKLLRIMKGTLVFFSGKPRLK